MPDIKNFRFRIAEFRAQGRITLDRQLWERLLVAMRAIKVSQQNAAPTNRTLQKCSLSLNIY
jgi:hypothetical protein